MVSAKCVNAVVLFTAAATLAAVAPEAVQTRLDGVLKAVESNDRAALVKDSTDAMDQALTPEMTAAVSEKLSPRLKNGYKAEYLTSLRQGGVTVHLWKIVFTDGGDDVVVRLAMQGDKMAGLFFQ